MYLFNQLKIIFGEVNFMQLKNACIRGALLPSEFKQQIKNAVELDDLLDVLDNPMYCNWLNIHHLERMVKSIDIPEAKNLIQTYKKIVYSRKVSDVIVHFKPKCFDPSHICLVRAKITKSIESVTVADIIRYCQKLESIMGVCPGSVTTKECQPGCLKVSCVIPVYYALHAYGTAKTNSLKFRQFHIQYIEIEPFPKVFTLNCSTELNELTSGTLTSCRYILLFCCILRFMSESCSQVK